MPRYVGRGGEETGRLGTFGLCHLRVLLRDPVQRHFQKVRKDDYLLIFRDFYAYIMRRRVVGDVCARALKTISALVRFFLLEWPPLHDSPPSSPWSFWSCRAKPRGGVATETVFVGAVCALWRVGRTCLVHGNSRGRKGLRVQLLYDIEAFGFDVNPSVFLSSYWKTFSTNALLLP